MDLLNVAVRWALYAALLPIFGVALFTLVQGSNVRSPVGRLLALDSLVAGVLSAFGVLVATAAMMGAEIAGVTAADVGAVLTGMGAGKAAIVRECSLSLVCAAALSRPKNVPAIFVAVTSGAAVASLAWTGHGAMDEGLLGNVHLLADIAHLLAAGAWLGGLLSLAMMVFRPKPTSNELKITRQALARFAATGTISVAVLIISGLINSWLLIGPNHIEQLGTTLYGQLLLVKLVVFAVMIALAAGNRFRLTPALERGLAARDPILAMAALRTSLALESLAALAVLGLVAWLGTLAPPISG